MNAHQKIFSILRNKFGDQLSHYRIPPPVFALMSGEFVDFDLEQGILTTRFPVKDDYLNPYGRMQGGMIAAAVDNTIGPLSILVAPPNVTRRLEMKYKLPIKPELEFILVRAIFVERIDPRLFFRAQVLSPEGKILAKAQATHWMIDPIK